MAEVTVKQFAEVVGIPVERLLVQLDEAGIPVSGEETTISDKQKVDLLAHLRKSHGKNESLKISEPKKITIKRKSRSEIRMPNASGPVKTVSVEVRKKRTYVKRGAVDEGKPASRGRDNNRQGGTPTAAVTRRDGRPVAEVKQPPAEAKQPVEARRTDAPPPASETALRSVEAPSSPAAETPPVESSPTPSAGLAAPGPVRTQGPATPSHPAAPPRRPHPADGGGWGRRPGFGERADRGPGDRGPQRADRGPGDRGPQRADRGPGDRGPQRADRGPQRADRGPGDRG
ncbi:MAG: translation initiation factor IF-2 associated domain-containing protein, partial [Candidatus Competibacterales bacterium]